MRVDVEEFGCVPDGRILDPVEIAAASQVLSAPRGGLRDSDAGKNVAIPGAVDLVETIAALVERREVRDARIELSEPDILAGTLFNPANGQDERFLARVHVGRRITVAGAGPGGQVLVTDVVEVLDGDRIKLRAPAAAAVVGVEVILNRPDVVSLGDYARRAVSGLTLDLGDRTIDDAGIALGARGLTSETARFSSEDLGTGVTIPAAGLFMTTIAAVDSPTSATLTAPAERSIAEEDGIPADVWRTDSRPGLELLLAAIGALRSRRRTSASGRASTTSRASRWAARRRPRSRWPVFAMSRSPGRAPARPCCGSMPASGSRPTAT